MSSIETFFNAWGMNSDNERAQAIASVYAKNGGYADPRSQTLLQGPDAITEYVNMFSANAPGWSAKVIKTDVIEGSVRATVAFGGIGPDGNEMVQHGQYFVDMDGELITRMIGFVGTGAPE
ncbi:nuclear transport factor 2 family protein [Planktotalea sp.]|uniref:nuclear transport factor 2 family protein n=1 Tax=Planktotalea sp. TaxID=2029877 RepID=UPI003D6A9FFA